MDGKMQMKLKTPVLHSPAAYNVATALFIVGKQGSQHCTLINLEFLFYKWEWKIAND